MGGGGRKKEREREGDENQILGQRVILLQGAVFTRESCDS